MQEGLRSLARSPDLVKLPSDDPASVGTEPRGSSRRETVEEPGRGATDDGEVGGATRAHW